MSKFRSLLAGLVVLALAWAVVGHRLAIIDWVRLRGYSPSPPVIRLANEDTMTSYTRHLFYLNRPDLLPTVTSFRQYCPENENTIVLGCYHPGENGIFIYNVQDPTLAGVQQVTAAHEVLHAVYERLSGKDKAALNAELENFYHRGLRDKRVLAEVKIYQKTEPGDVMDEMSCTFGTEVAKLPVNLENYYKNYFSDRAAIVAYEQKYEGEFASRQATIKADDQKLANLKKQITAFESSLGSQLNRINNDRNLLNALLAKGENGTYNGLVPGFNNEVRQYNDSVNNLQADVAYYNQLVDTRNQVAGQLDTLDKALDTRLTQINSTP